MIIFSTMELRAKNNRLTSTTGWMFVTKNCSVWADTKEVVPLGVKSHAVRPNHGTIGLTRLVVKWGHYIHET